MNNTTQSLCPTKTANLWMQLRLFALSFGVFVLVAGNTWVVARRVVINHDVAWLILAGARLWHGGSYTHDFFEPTPLFGLWLYTPPAIMQQCFGGSLVSDAFWYLVMLPGILAGISFAILGYKQPFLTQGIAGLACFFGIGCTCWFFPLEIGQKDLLIMFLSTPLLALTLRCCYTEKPLPNTARLGIAVFAAWSGLIKSPLIIGMPMVWLFWQNRRDLTFWSTIGLLAVGTILTLHCGWYQVFSRNALLYESYNDPLSTVIVYVLPWTFFTIGGAYLLFQHPHTRWARLAPWFLGLSLGDTALVVLQHKAWSYHLFPIQGLAFWIALVLIVAPTRGLHRVLDRLIRAACVVSIGWFLTIGVFTWQHVDHTIYAPHYFVERPLSRQILALAPTQSWVFWDTSIEGFPLALYTNAAWASKYPSLWQLPWIINTERNPSSTPQQRGVAKTAKAQFFQEFVADLRARNPSVVYIRTQQSHQAVQTPVDLIRYLNENSDFHRWFANYHEVPTKIPNLQAYMRGSTTH